MTKFQTYVYSFLMIFNVDWALKYRIHVDIKRVREEYKERIKARRKEIEEAAKKMQETKEKL